MLNLDSLKLFRQYNQKTNWVLVCSKNVMCILRAEMAIFKPKPVVDTPEMLTESKYGMM